MSSLVYRVFDDISLLIHMFKTVGSDWTGLMLYTEGSKRYELLMSTTIGLCCKEGKIEDDLFITQGRSLYSLKYKSFIELLYQIADIGECIHKLSQQSDIISDVFSFELKHDGLLAHISDIPLLVSTFSGHKFHIIPSSLIPSSLVPHLISHHIISREFCLD